MSGIFNEISTDRSEEFFRKGHRKRSFFPHEIYYLPKCGPDALKLSERMCSVSSPASQWQILLHATTRATDEFPDDLFFDNDLIWHQQQLGNNGHIAFAYIVIKGSDLYGLNYVSDLVQRVSRRREYKTRVEKVFHGWIQMLLNSILNFALQKNIKTIYSPTADLALANTDRTRVVQRELFERTYDRAVNNYFRTTKEGKWWRIHVKDNEDKAVRPIKRESHSQNRKLICVCHDIEKGLGHINSDQEFAKLADRDSPANLKEMLRVEKEFGLKATYNIVGCLLEEFRPPIEADGHCLGFHSYDHEIKRNVIHSLLTNKNLNRLFKSLKKRSPGRRDGQLHRCRTVDYRIKGYRPPQSKMTRELSEKNLCLFNFEWLASSIYSLGMKTPVQKDRVVKIPIAFDDYALFRRHISFEEWEKKAIASIQQNQIVAFSLHDCYAHYWLPYYRMFLEKIRPMGEMATLTEVSNQIILSNGI